MARCPARRPGSGTGPPVPARQRGHLTAVEELIKLAADAGCSLTHLELAFVTGHPAVTAAIIGPRTMDQLTDLLAGASGTLTDDVLDQIDRIVPPGVPLRNAERPGSGLGALEGRLLLRQERPHSIAMVGGRA